MLEHPHAVLYQGQIVAAFFADGDAWVAPDGRLITTDFIGHLTAGDVVVVQVEDITTPSVAGHVDSGYSDDVADWTAQQLEVEVEVETETGPETRDKTVWVVTREQRWRERTFADAFTEAENRRGIRALTVHSAPKFVPLTGLLGPSSAQIDTNAAGEFVGMHQPENGCVIGMSLMKPTATGYVDNELIHAGTGYWIEIKAQRTDIPEAEMREFTGFRNVNGTLVKSRFQVPNLEVKAKLLDPYGEEAAKRQSDYEADRRLLETAKTIPELDALFR